MKFFLYYQGPTSIVFNVAKCYFLLEVIHSKVDIFQHSCYLFICFTTLTFTFDYDDSKWYSFFVVSISIFNKKILLHYLFVDAETAFDKPFTGRISYEFIIVLKIGHSATLQRCLYKFWFPVYAETNLYNYFNVSWEPFIIDCDEVNSRLVPILRNFTLLKKIKDVKRLFGWPHVMYLNRRQKVKFAQFYLVICFEVVGKHFL